MKNRIAPMATAFAILCSFSGVYAGENERTESVKSQPRKAATVESRKKSTPAKRKWRLSAKEPCDGIVCRLQRFAWSPIAPGA